MKNFLIIFLLTTLISTGVNAQQKNKRTFQYAPGVNKKSISGVVTKLTSSTLGDQKLIWVHIGDTVIHVWDKDLKKEMEVGKAFTFNGIQKLVGVKKHIEN